MDDLAERIKASIEDPNTDSWFPELTDELTAREWDRLHRDIGLTPNNYGTTRVLSRSISTPRHVIASLTSSSCGTPLMAVEALTQECAVQYKKQGVTFFTSDDILHSAILSCIEDALTIINQVPSLMRTVATLVRSLHVIEPADQDHDVSFSEPTIPFSIFVSVPNERVENGPLRIAEAIVHEAMHLQLTLIERVQPLISRKDRGYLSPWRREYRNAQGLIHGLYVFRVIAEFLLNLNVNDYSELDHVSGRRLQISADIDQIRFFSDSSELTSIGSAFVGRLLNSSVMDFG